MKGLSRGADRVLAFVPLRASLLSLYLWLCFLCPVGALPLERAERQLANFTLFRWFSLESDD